MKKRIALTIAFGAVVLTLVPARSPARAGAAEAASRVAEEERSAVGH